MILEDGREAWLAVVGRADLAEAGCLTAVTGLDRGEALAAFGAEVDSPMTLEESWEAMIPCVSAVQAGDAVLLVEGNGFQGSRPEVMRRAAARGRAASIYWNVNAVVRLGCAQDGVVLGNAELMWVDESTELPADLLPGLMRAEADGLDMVLAGAEAASLFAGVPLDRWRIATGTPVYPLITVVEDLQPIYPEYSTLQRILPELTERLLAAPGAVQRRVAESAALKALQATGLDDDPRAAAVASHFAGNLPARFDPAMELLVEISRESDLLNRTDPSRHGGVASQAMHDAWMRTWAIRALRYATAADPVTAAIGATEALGPFVAHDQAALAAHVTPFLNDAGA